MKKIFTLLLLLAGVMIHASAQVAGSSRTNPINAGVYSSSGTGTFTDTKNNANGNGFTNNFGQASNDVWYMFVLGSSMNGVSVSLCGSNFDTYLHVTNYAGTEIASNDDNGPLCSGTASSLTFSNLASGTYYVVAEGYSTNTGSIQLALNVNLIQPVSASYNTPQTYAAGSAIPPLSPAVSGTFLPATGLTGTFAGSGSAGSTNGDGTSASFNQPLGATTDPSGNIYIAEGGSHLIRKVTVNGTVTTFAGTGSPGFVNGTGTGASFYHPVGLASDASGNIYVADEDNNVIRKITPAGVVSTFAGSGIQGSADGAPGSASFYYPCGVAVDGSGNVYVADTYNNRIRKITAAGVVSTLAGSGTAASGDGTGAGASFNQPFSVVTDVSGNIYVTDRVGAKIRKVTPGGQVSTLAGSGTAGYAEGAGTAASFNGPTGLAIDKAGNLYVTDEANNRIRKVTAAGAVTTLSGTGAQGSVNGAGTASTFYLPFAIAAEPGGLVYVGDLTTNLIRKIVGTPYTISPALPAGLSMNSETGVVSGTPAAVMAQTSYAVRVNSTSNSIVSPLMITVKPLGLAFDQNYIVTYMPRNAGLTTDALVTAASWDKNSEQVDVQYFDGLGRPLQTVQVKGSPQGKDLVTPIAYDPYGREAQKYLTYASPTADGSYKVNAISTELGNFYNPGGNGTSGGQQTNGSGVVVNPAPYSLTVLESSPLNRVIEQGASGTDWQPSAGHTQKIAYVTNDQSSTFSTTPGSGNPGSRIAVLYQANINADQSRALTTNGTYVAGQLYVTVAKNENWNAANDGCTNTTEEYKDKEGHVVLKRTYNLNAVTNKIEELSTYYVYDDLGNLAFVLPPGANPDAGVTSAAGQTTLDNLCYQYRYDERNRLSQKKLPGKGWEYMVYNKRNQPVLTQDAVQRLTNQWTVTKYDALGRVILTGLWDAGSVKSQASLQASIYAGAQWDVRNTADMTTGYTVTSYPALTSYLSINYYDDYSFSNITGFPAVFNTGPANAASQVRSLLTASKINVLGSSNMLWTVNYYDDRGRNIQTYKQHYLGGVLSAANYDKIISTYNFNNQVTNTARQHYTNVSGNAVLAATVADQYIYDHRGRKQKSWQTLTGTPRTLLNNLIYNEAGQLWKQYLHTTDTVANNFKQEVDLTYNERGWQVATTTSGNLFKLDLKYNSPDAGLTPQYNGNISQMNYLTTKVATPGARTFGYTYDKLGRLTNASFTGGTANDALNEQVSYDVMGNISQLLRSGQGAGTLNYTSYTGNQLNTVTGYSPRSYSYDGNGNASGDGTGKGITYNLLNLPNQVRQGTTVLATYIYDAGGQKLRNVSTTDGSWDYIGGIVYHNNAIAFIQTEEGRATPNAGVYSYQYDLKDHLGNTRVTFDIFSNAARVIQEDEYYSFGLRKPTGRYDFSNNNKYLYNGKELQADLQNQYDYGARFYDPVIARWTTMDPLAEKNRRWTPYNYAVNNPIRFIDPDGCDTAQRNAAIREARKWVAGNDGGNGDTYLYGAKPDAGDYGAKIDCSGLLSLCAEAGGEKNPNYGDEPNGIRNIRDNLKNVDSKDVVPGNFALVNNGKGDYKHGGIITSVQRDKDGNIINEKWIASGGHGPKETYLIKNGVQTMEINSYVKFDTKPDKTGPVSNVPAPSNNNSNGKNEKWGGFIDYIVKKVSSWIEKK